MPASAKGEALLGSLFHAATVQPSSASLLAILLPAQRKHVLNCACWLAVLLYAVVLSLTEQQGWLAGRKGNGHQTLLQTGRNGAAAMATLL